MAIQQFKTAHLQVIRIVCRLLATAVLVTGCEKHDIPDPEPAGPSHTLLLYMPGQSLLSYYKSNIQHVGQGLSADVPGNGHILVCYQPDNQTSAQLLELRYDDKQQTCVRETLRVYDDFRAENPESLRQLFRDAQQLAPADNYGLIIGCHGTAWLPAGTVLSAPNPDASLPVLLTRTTSDADYVTRSFGDPGHQLAVSELAEVAESLPYRFDYLIFDGCFMASIETLYDLRHTFDYVVASPCEILVAGFPYQQIIPHIFGAEDHNLTAVCHDFWSFYMYDWNTLPGNAPSACISLAVMDELEVLADRAADIYAGPQRAYQRDELQHYESLTSHVFYDFGDYIRAIAADDALLARFEAQLDRAFPVEARLHTPEFYSVFNRRWIPVNSYSGVSTGEPSLRYVANEEETAWFRRTHARQ